MEIDQTVALLKRSMPFQTVPNDVLEAIARLARYESYARGDVIYHQGDFADDVYIVSSGSVQHTLGIGFRRYIRKKSCIAAMCSAGQPCSRISAAVWQRPSAWNGLN